MSLCVCNLDVLREQSHPAFGGSTPHHHVVAGGHQPPGQRAGEVARAQDANHRGAGLRHEGLEMSGGSAFTSASHQGPRHVIRHGALTGLQGQEGGGGGGGHVIYIHISSQARHRAET